MGRVTQRRKVHKYVLDGSPNALEFPVRYREDVLAVEEPLEIRLGSMSFSVTMAFDGDTYPTVDPLAIQWSSEGSYIWRVAGDKSEKVPVKIIQRNPDKVLVDAALNEGDEIVTEGVQRLRDGGEVRIAGRERKQEPAQKVAEETK